MLTAYLKRQWKLLLLLAGAVAVFAAVFALYGLPVEAVAYAGLLCLVLGVVLFALGYSAFLRRHRELDGLLRRVHEPVLPLPPPRGVLEADYQALLGAVCADRVRLAAENRDRLEDMTDYYTLWAHQIKTPIAASIKECIGFGDAICDACFTGNYPVELSDVDYAAEHEEAASKRDFIFEYD